MSSRIGIDLAQTLGLKDKVSWSWLRKFLDEKAIFKLCFGIAFTLSTFLRVDYF